MRVNKKKLIWLNYIFKFGVVSCEFLYIKQQQKLVYSIVQKRHGISQMVYRKFVNYDVMTYSRFLKIKLIQM